MYYNIYLFSIGLTSERFNFTLTSSLGILLPVSEIALLFDEIVINNHYKKECLIELIKQFD